MATLYELDQAILDCCDKETGEILDIEALDALMMQRTQKIESVALWVKNLQSDALAFKAEKEAFEKREKAATKKAEQLKAWLAYALEGQKFNTAKCAVSFRRSERVDIIDESLVPAEFMTATTTYKPDKAAIKQAFREGHSVNGCCVTELQNAWIR